MGIVGAVVIARWSWSLINSSALALLDAVPDPELALRIRNRIEVDGDRVCDLHLWRLGPGHLAVIVALVTDDPKPPEAHKARLGGLAGLSRVTVEVHRCPGHARCTKRARREG